MSRNRQRARLAVSPRLRIVLRELWHLRGQVLAAALVVACGISAFVALRATYHSLLVAQADYYAAYRFADVFARLERAPEGLAARVGEVPGVAEVRTRVVVDVTLDVPGLAEPATGRLVSIPERREPMLNDLALRAGRWIEPGRAGEAIASETFARANGLRIGDTVGAILNGRWARLTIVGLALSPEYVYEVGPGKVFPDNRRFGVLWMSREALGPAFDMDGAFNDLALSLAEGASAQEVVDRLDRLLAPYGGLSAYPRRDQLSHRFLADEFGEIEIMTTYIPALFLGVAAFLLYVVLSRMVSMQRAQIGLLKAFGYADIGVGMMYLGFAVCVVAIGASAGVALGAYMGGLVTDLYAEYFHFPRLAFELRPPVLVATVLIGLAAATIGALGAVRGVLALPPAEAMRPEAPASFREGWLDRSGLARFVAPALRMILRNLARRPWKALLSIVGIALAVGTMVVGRFGIDGAAHLLHVQLDLIQRGDVSVTFHEPRESAALNEVARLPGVLRAEGFRAVPVWLRNGHRAKKVQILGLAPDAELHRLLDRDLRPVPIPPDGLALSRKLAELLGLAPGDVARIEVLEGAREVRELPVAAIVDEYLGLGAYMDGRALARLLREDAPVSGVNLRVDPARAADLFSVLKGLPPVAGVEVKETTRAVVQDSLDRAIRVFSRILVGFAGIIVLGVVYNSARIALSERGNELASLRVLGFRNREVLAILLGEQALLVATAIPLGLLAGYGMSAALATEFEREMFRIPLEIDGATYAYATLAAVGAALLSGVLVARRVRSLDLIAVLKTRE
ncbi:ABC transporter permease [Burkholderiaceae bacterium FT117]|uniref:ABC transporter permease n=1 Tax=Zeimonas sediminis TaxID=2944268 RepID=UPI002342EE93|nr:ABC transporter permease [Zeimonas sediminis]MCM5572224.1 ABC transporter permease [Zeimonas sediminis]